MDRRQFIAAGGWAAAAPMLAQAAGTGAGAGERAGMFEQVDFVSDGLGLSPREYAALLHEATTRNLEPDYYSIGGTVAALERKFAQLLGKEAAMFVPTGTLANHLAVRKLAGSDRRVLVQAESHLYNDSGDCATTLSGLTLVPLAEGGSTIALAEAMRWVERSAGGRVETRVGVISIENPVRRRDHERVDFADLERLCDYARGQGIRLHLDGARMFNLPLHSGRSVRDYAALFDTVYVSLWKHFNAAAGAILAGDAAFIDELFHMRRMFGGALPHAWPQVALAASHADSYEQDYARAWRVADQLLERLQSDGRFRIRKLAHGTSRFFLAPIGVEPDVLAGRARARGVLLPRAHPETGEWPMQVNPTLLRVPPATLAQVFIDSIQG